MRYLIAMLMLITGASRLMAQTPPDFTLVDQDSISWNLYDEVGKGNTVLLDFFYANCVPCQTFTPEIEQIYKDYGSGAGNLIVLGISYQDNNTALATFDSTYGVTYPTGGTQGNGGDITNLYASWFGLSWWPNYAVVCTDTTIFWGVNPSIGMAEIRNKIDTCDIVTDITAIEPNEDAFSLFPNPAKEYVNVELSRTFRDASLISLYNLHGTLIVKTSIALGEPISLNLNDVPAGYYLIEVSRNDMVYGREKMVILH